MVTFATPTGTSNIGILGIGAYRPQRLVTNDEICANIDVDSEWIYTRTGIKTRRFCGRDENITTMSVAAGRAALGQTKGFFYNRVASEGEAASMKYPLPYILRFFFYTLFYLAVYPCGNNDLSRIHVACFYNKIVVLLIRFFFVFRLYYYVGFNSNITSYRCADLPRRCFLRLLRLRLPALQRVSAGGR